MKKFLALLAVGGASLATFAAGESTTTALIDTSDLNTALGTLAGNLTSWVSDALPIILPIAGAFMIFWLVKIAIRIIKSFGSSAK